MELHFPRIPQCESGRFLVMYLTNVDESVRHKLEELVASALDSLKDDSKYQGQKPFYLPATKHRYQLKKEMLDQIDTFSNLYQIAAESRRKGWEEIILVDSRTVRQLQGKPHHSGWEEATLVVIRTGLCTFNVSNGNGGADRGGFSAEVGRGFADAAIRCVLLRDSKGIREYFRGREEDYPNSYSEPWVGLYNPDLPPLSVDALSPAQSDATACLSRFLPLELVDNIIEFTKADTPLEKLTTSPQRLDFRRSTILVLSLIPLYQEELARTEGMLRDAIKGQGSDANLVIYPWLASIPGRRSDLYRLYERVMNNHPGWKAHGWFLFLTRAILEPNPLVGIAFGRNSLELQTQYILPNQVAQAWESACTEGLITLEKFLRKSSKNALVEQLRDPGRKYACDLPPYIARDREDKLAAFLLSKSFTDDERAAVKEKLECPEDDYLKIYLLPWDKEEDGTEDDICRIFQDINRLYCNTCVIFVDRQTLVDDTVIVPDKWLHYNDGKDDDIPFDPVLLGTKYGRVMAQSMASMWANLRIANMGYEEWVEKDDTTFVPLPGVVFPDPESESD